MSQGVLWSLVAALGFGFTQTLNRKSNLLVGASRTAFGLLLAVESILLVRMIITGEFRLLSAAPWSALAFFTGSATIHYILGWTFLAMSQHQIGVARTGAVVSAAPLVGTILAAPVLGEPLTGLILIGVLATVVGVALISVSRGDASMGGIRTVPSFGLLVALCWGSSPMLIRKGLEGLDAPVLGLTVGLGVALVIHAVALTITRSWTAMPWDRRALVWMGLGGATGAVGIGAQWTSFGLTTIAVAITVQQLAVLVVVGLAPIMFRSPMERLNRTLLIGTAAVIMGSLMVVLSSR
jgi:drug/metabolite transporter (DMT)-like permease